jgi:hypothetical protein
MGESKQTKNKKRARRIDVLFSIVGTAIVLITFYVHEVKREEAKEAADTVASTLATENLEEAISNGSSTVIRHLIDSSYTEPSSKGLTKRESVLLRSVYLTMFDVDALQFDSWNQANALHALEKSVATLKDKKDYPNRLTTMRSELDKAANDGAEVYIAVNGLKREAETVHPIPATFWSKVNPVEERVALFQWESGKIIDKASALREDILKHMQTQADLYKQRYERLTSWSYFLYPLGFLLGLIGKLLGIEVATDA